MEDCSIQDERFVPRMNGTPQYLLFSLLLACGSAVAQLHQYKATDIPRPGENIAQPCDYQASFPAGNTAVKAAWVTYDRGPDITRFYSDPDVLAFERPTITVTLLSRKLQSWGLQ